MSTILSVSVASSFSASPIDAAAPVPEELDPRFVEELQGALGRQEPPGYSQMTMEDSPEPDPVQADQDAVSSLQNLPLMPWVAMTLPANFASTEPVANSLPGEPACVAVEGVRGSEALTSTSTMTQAQAPAPVTALEAQPAEGAALANTDPSGEAVPSYPLPLASDDMTAGQLLRHTAAPSETLPSAPPELMAPNPLIHSAGSSTPSAANPEAVHSSAQHLAGGGRSEPRSTPPAQPAGDAAAITTSTLQSRDETTPARDVTATTASLGHRDETGSFQVQRSDRGLAEATRLEETRALQGADDPEITELGVPKTADSVSAASWQETASDNGAAAVAGAVQSALTQLTSAADVSPDGASLEIATALVKPGEDREQSAPFVAGQGLKAYGAQLPAVSSVEQQVPALAAPLGLITGATPALSEEVTAQALSHQGGEPARVSTHDENADEEADLPAQSISRVAVTAAASPSESAGDSDVTASRAVEHTREDSATAAALQDPAAPVASAGAQRRADQAASESTDEVSAVRGSSETPSTRGSGLLASNTSGVGATEATTQDLRSAKSTFASSFVQALMGQVHHPSAQHSQPLDVVPSPAPMAPHQVRLDAGQVQVEVVRLVKLGGGQVVMELTPPDESKFKIDLTISQQGVARLVVDGASDSTRLRLEQTVSGLQDQFQQMGLQLQLDMRQPHQQEARSQSPDMMPDQADNGPRVSATLAAPAPSLNGRPTWEQGQVYLVA
jgi:hypothetical protein